MTRAAARQAAEQRSRRVRGAAFAFVVVAVLGVGAAMATGDLFGQRGSTTMPDAIAIRASMAGFTPNVIEARAGEQVAIDFWTTDAAPHLMRGVHTFISDELGIKEELPADSRRTFSFTAPTEPGDYDVYCDTCCGGRESPTMHGTIRITAA
jgi:heme/copper-type cytochrome/quinol oxidase subunit 2